MDSPAGRSSPPAIPDNARNTHISLRNDSSPKRGTPIRRTRTGCRACRDRKVKCDEAKPVCARCRAGSKTCEWPEPSSRRARLPRRPNSTACDACRDKKLKCVGDVRYVCEKCRETGAECVRTQRGIGSAASQPLSLPSENETGASTGFLSVSMLPPSAPPPMLQTGGSETECQSPLTSQSYETAEAPLGPASSGQLPAGKELEDLVQLYFSSVHHFGFFAFIHQAHFNRLLSKGKAPRELTLMMIASAVRFAGKITPENLARADSWADAAIGALLARIYQGFGAIQLMALLLAQQYDLNRGNFTAAWIMGANCTRMMQMMSLQTFDRTYPANITSLRLSPLLSCEALRRVAWSTFYIDTIVDGGRYGFHTIDEKAYRLQLPCDQASFLSNEAVFTEPLFYDPADAASSNVGQAERAPLDMSAYLLRTAAARRRALHFAFRASHGEQTVERLSAELAALETDMEQVIAALPQRFNFNADNKLLHRDRLSTFILLHIIRHNLFIVLGRAALQVYQRDPATAERIPSVRRKRISHALPIAGLVLEGLKAEISFDPQIGVQAYVALEILLFEPPRLAEIDPSIDPKAPELREAISHLLTVIRSLSDRSEFVKQLHIEAVCRLLRRDCTQLLNQADLAAFRSEYRMVGQDDAEYDFRDFRWAKLERVRRGAKSSAHMSRDEALLEYKVGGETAPPSAAPSPRLDAIDITSAAASSATQMHSSISSVSLDLHGARDIYGAEQTSQFWWGLTEAETADGEFSLGWSSWLLDESGYPWYQAGGPTAF